MPRIPTYTTTIDYRPPRGDLETAAMPGQMLARFGEAVGGFGEALLARQDASDKQGDLNARVTQIEAEIERSNGTAQMMRELRKSIESFNAAPDPATMMDRRSEQTSSLRQTIESTIADPTVRAQVAGDTAGIVGLHVALMQGDKVRRLAHDGRRDLERNLALYGEMAESARHPQEFDEVMGLAMGEIQRKAAAGFFTAEDAANLEQSFYADVSERQARQAIAADPQGALASLKGNEDFATLPAERRTRLMKEAERAVRDQAIAHTTALAADRRTMEIRLPGFVGALRDGSIPDDDGFSRDSLIAAFGETDGARRWGEIEDARAFGKATARVKWATPDEITRLLDGGDDPDSPDAAASHRPWLSQAVDRRNEQLREQPADYVLANPRIAALHEALHQTTAQPKIPAALTAALQAGGAPALAAAGASDEDRRSATEAFANAALAEQARLGLPEDRRQVLPKAMAQDLVARILDGDTKAAADTLSEFIANWGDAAPTALADLSRHGLPGEYRLLASFTDPVGRQTFAKVLMAQAAEPGALRRGAGDDAGVIDDLVRVNSTELVQADPTQTTGDDQPHSTVKRTAEGIPLPPPPSPRPRNGFGGPRVAPGQSVTRRDIEPKPPANLSPDIAEVLRRNRLTPIWRDTIGRLETLGRPYDGYGTSLADKNNRGVEGYALGRYQLRQDSLIDTDMMTEMGEWSGKYGVRSWQDFLNNPQAQEATLVDWSEKTDRYIRTQHAARLNKQITGIKADITVTESGLAAAVHKEGTGGVSRYFRWLEKHGWNSRAHQQEMQSLPTERRRSFLAVETRLREFQNVPYKSR